MAKENKTQDQEEKKEYKEIILKFGKGLVGEPFTGKDGKEYKQISIPNKDENDKSPWASFVVRANAVHEDKFGKGMWVKLPSEGATTVRKDKVVGTDKDGKNIYETEKTKIPNKELKSMVEFYKEKSRDSVKGKLSEKKAQSDRANESRPKGRNKAKEAAI